MCTPAYLFARRIQALREGPSMAYTDAPLLDPIVRNWPQCAESVALARHHLRAALAEWGMGELTAPAELVLSELVTNAVKHARSCDTIGTRYVPQPDGGLRLEVADGDRERLPCPRAPSVDSLSGRGLHMVEGLAGGRWGVEQHPDGKTVWVVLAGD
jgi:serine/threonine-protein kinase RsbW